MDQANLSNGEQVLAGLRAAAHELGFSQIGVADVDLTSAEPGLAAWLAAGFHGGMGYMAAHGLKRARPADLVPGTVRVVTARMDYLPADVPPDWQDREWTRLRTPGEAVVSIYARGRDYHKTLRQRLQKLAEALATLAGPLGFRVFTDSAPVLEVELATRSGLGWRGKHTLSLTRQGGSMGFLGEIYIDMPLPLTPPDVPACGSCTACIDACPTQAIVAPYRVDARRCISYLTIEHDGPIPEPLRKAIGSRVYGCDDCQLACPWNKFASPARVVDFAPRAAMDAGLLAWWAWDEAAFLRHTEGTAVRRIGFQRWQRNLAVVSGNRLAAVPDDAALRAALVRARTTAPPMVQAHIDWALAQ